MRRITGTVLIVLWSTLLGAQTIDPPCKPAQQTDWERDGLRGHVKAIRTFKTWFRQDQETKLITKGTPELEEEASYNSKGIQISGKNTNYLPVDPNDRVIVEYGCDSSNRIAEIRYKHLKESSFRRTVYSFDEKGRDREQAEYFADGTLERLETYSYDDNGNRIEVIAKQQVHPEHFSPRH